VCTPDHWSLETQITFYIGNVSMSKKYPHIISSINISEKVGTTAIKLERESCSLYIMIEYVVVHAIIM